MGSVCRYIVVVLFADGIVGGLGLLKIGLGIRENQNIELN